MSSKNETDFVRERYAPFRAQSGKRMPFETADFRAVCAPWDLMPIAMVGWMTEAQAFENLDTLCRTFAEQKQPKTHERIAILKRAARRLEDRHEQFSDLIAWEGGKPLKDARAEVTRAISSLEYAAEEAERLNGTELPMRATKAASGRIAFTYPEPIGVVLAISAFNHPLNLIIHQVAPAIAVGCPVMIKPASETPLSCLHFLEILYEAGLPPEMCLPLVCENEVSEKLARSSKIGFLTFIGSAKVGWHLRSVLAPGTRFSLEHGGSAPVLVDASADLELVIPTLIKGGYYHAGQVCVSVQRIFVHEDVRTEFQAKFVAAVKALQTGNPRLLATDCGPIIRRRDLDRIDDWVSAAVKGGAELLTGGDRIGETCFEPTVLANAKDADQVMKDEIFGPVVCLQTFREISEGVAKANSVDWRFQSAVFSNDLERALQAVRLLRASAVMVNDATTFRVDWMPFRGDGPSGFGTGGIPYSMRDLVSEKLVVIKSPAFEL
jgi:acyl-CoA reductase-like NAD-dependent aldehyde dehydrogenase